VHILAALPGFEKVGIAEPRPYVIAMRKEESWVYGSIFVLKIQQFEVRNYISPHKPSLPATSTIKELLLIRSASFYVDEFRMVYQKESAVGDQLHKLLLRGSDDASLYLAQCIDSKQGQKKQPSGPHKSP
jgi:hypothetical protein